MTNEILPFAVAAPFIDVLAVSAAALAALVLTLEALQLARPATTSPSPLGLTGQGGGLASYEDEEIASAAGTRPAA